MIASYGETSGFSAVGAGELALVNGGGGDSGGGSSSSGSTHQALQGISYPKSSGNGVSVDERGITVTKDSGSLNITGSLNPPSVTATLTARF
jgi:hypothetical protein